MTDNTEPATGDKPVEGDWNEAAQKSEQSWNQDAPKPANAPEQSDEASMDTMREGYGTGKENADPQADRGGRFPENPSG